MKHPLKHLNDWVNPYWGYHMGYSPTLYTIAADHTIEIRAHVLGFEDPSTAPAPGTEVYVTQGLGGQVYVETVADVEARRLSEKQAAELKEEIRKTRSRNARHEAIALNTSIQLPVTWEPAIKDVLSGLSPNSWGDGRNRSTVQHIRLLEDFQSGRIKRKPGDFLCTAPKGDNGKAWANGSKSSFVDCDGNYYDAPVTCKRCLELAQPFIKPTE